MLEGHEPTTSSYRSGSYGYSSSSYLGVQVPSHYAAALNSFSQVEGYINESLNSLPGSQMPSGRESPESHFEVDYRTSFMRHNKAASETGGPNSAQSIIRRVGAMNIGSRNQESEDKILDRFREVSFLAVILCQ
ncbi:unnamed protein product [Trichobilharzia regenti]|nr:unnamed protein product [Trichobilharzia regenti]